MQDIQDIIENIVINFKTQQTLYLRMAEMARIQLNCLQQQTAADPAGLPELLQARQELMQEIDSLNKQNQVLQEQVVVKLQLPDFSLSHMENQIETGLFQSLREVIDRLRDILADISTIDEQNHALLKKTTGTGQLKPSVNRQKAQNAYRQAAKQGKKKN